MLVALRNASLVAAYQEAQCHPAHTGPLCDACKPGYYLPQAKDLACAPCSPNTAATVVTFLLRMLVPICTIAFTMWGEWHWGRGASAH